MKTKFLYAAATAAFAVTLSASAAFAGYLQPGETMGVSLVSPLPEGVFFADLEDYGRGDVQPQTNLGVNIPVFIWSTPYTFYNTRLEFIVAFPFVHADTSGGLPGGNFVAPITWAAGALFAHDFGNGLTGGVGGLFRTPAPSAITLPLWNVSGADFRQSLQYTIATPGPFSGITLIENASFTTDFGAATGSQNDMFAGDFAIEKTFDKFTIGFTGFGNIDTGTAPLAPKFQSASIELGGLVGYDFGKFNLTGIVTRSVYVKGGAAGISDTLSAGYETRGWVRLIVPLYVAPTAPVIAARY